MSNHGKRSSTAAISPRDIVLRGACYRARDAWFTTTSWSLCSPAVSGERLFPLTKERAKPAVYFGGPYRIIDFVLSNCLNSGFRRIFIATQYKSLSLNRHIRQGWSIVSEELGEFIEILPPQKRVGEHWYQGTADAVYQNLYSIVRENAALRHRAGRRSHLQDGLPQDAAGAHRHSAPRSRWPRSKCRSRTAAASASSPSTKRSASIGFQEKPAEPASIPGVPHLALASMGIYVFNIDVLVSGARGGCGRSPTAITTSARTSSRR